MTHMIPYVLSWVPVSSNANEVFIKSSLQCTKYCQSWSIVNEWNVRHPTIITVLYNMSRYRHPVPKHLYLNYAPRLQETLNSFNCNIYRGQQSWSHQKSLPYGLSSQRQKTAGVWQACLWHCPGLCWQPGPVGVRVHGSFWEDDKKWLHGRWTHWCTLLMGEHSVQESKWGYDLSMVVTMIHMSYLPLTYNLC